MPRIPRIPARSRKELADPPEPAADIPQPAAGIPQPAADTREPAPLVRAGDGSETIATGVEGTAGTPPVTTESPVLAAESPVSSAETTAMDPAPQALGEPAAEDGGEPSTAGPGQPEQGSFLDRGRMRRRLRYLRRTRELAFRDLGGLLFDLNRFARSRDDLVQGKLERLTAIDTELRALEAALDDHQEVTVLREPGLTACPRCGALHGSDAHYCPMCALPVRPGAGLPVRPVAGLPVASPDPAPPAAPVAEG